VDAQSGANTVAGKNRPRVCYTTRQKATDVNAVVISVLKTLEVFAIDCVVNVRFWPVPLCCCDLSLPIDERDNVSRQVVARTFIAVYIF
jgi:hypothetical protein